MGWFHPAPHRLDRDAFTKTHVEDSAYNTKLATRVAEDSIPTGDKPTIYDL